MKYFFYLLILATLYFLMGCEEDNPTEPVKSLTGRFAINIIGTSTLTGVLNLNEVSGKLSGSINITGFGQTSINGNSTNSTISFYFLSQEDTYVGKWVLSGSHNYTNMSGECKVYNNDTGSLVGTLSWNAKRD